MDPLNTDATETGSKKALSSTAETSPEQSSGKADLKQTVHQVTDKGLELARERLEFLREESAELLKSVEKAIRKNPIGAVSLAAGIGFLFAGLAGFVARGVGRS